MASVRPLINEMQQLGSMPTDQEADADEARADRWEELVTALNAQGNVTVPEARVLVQLLPVDETDCYGVAWTLLHVIESASEWPDQTALDAVSGPWGERLRERRGPRIRKG